MLIKLTPIQIILTQIFVTAPEIDTGLPNLQTISKYTHIADLIMAKTHGNTYLIENSDNNDTDTSTATHTTYTNHKCTKPTETNFRSEHQIESNNKTDEKLQILHQYNPQVIPYNITEIQVFNKKTV